MSVSHECYMLWGRGLCDGPIPRQMDSHQLWRVLMWSWSLEFEEDLAHWGLWRHAKKQKNKTKQKKQKQVTVFNANPNGVWILLLRYVSLYSFTPSSERGSFASLTTIWSVNKQYIRLWWDAVTCKRFGVITCCLNTIRPLRKCTRFSACKYKLRIETLSRLSFLFI